MENSIVKIQNNELVVGTWELSKKFDTEHRSLRRLVVKYKDEFEEFGSVKNWNFDEKIEESENIHCNAVVMNPVKKRGGQVEEFTLNYEQYVYLCTLVPNTDKSRQIKKTLSKEFLKMRQVLINLTIQRQNQEWKEKREAGKIERRLETDAIKEFIEYAKGQGSQSADKYYMIISKMENQSLVNIEILQQKFENVRDMIEGFDLTTLQIADKIIAVSLTEGMKLEMFYKDIYVMARDKVEGFSLTIGRTPLRLMKKPKEIK